MLRRLFNRLATWFGRFVCRVVDRRARLDAQKVARMYAATLPSALAKTRDPKSEWHEGYAEIEVPETTVAGVTPYCACAVSRKRFPERFLDDGSWPSRCNLSNVRLGV